MSVSILLMVAIGGCSGKPVGHVVELDPLGIGSSVNLSLGEITGGTSQQFVVRVWNSSDRQIKVVRVECSCDCASLAPVPFSVGPRESLPIELRVDLARDAEFAGELGLQFAGYDPAQTAVMRLHAHVKVSRKAAPYAMLP